MMDTMLSWLHERKKVAADRVLAELAEVPTFACIPEVLEDARERGYRNLILSDANTLYIRSILGAKGWRCACCADSGTCLPPHPSSACAATSCRRCSPTQHTLRKGASGSLPTTRRVMAARGARPTCARAPCWTRRC